MMNVIEPWDDYTNTIYDDYEIPHRINQIYHMIRNYPDTHIRNQGIRYLKKLCEGLSQLYDDCQIKPNEISDDWSFVQMAKADDESDDDRLSN